MRYWWVNHSQTFRQEFEGRYIWCPKLRQDGKVNHFYETVREVQPGDLVFSYANSAIQGFGFAFTHCYSCPRPGEFGRIGEAWDERGWRVDVAFRSFNSPLRTIENASQISPHLPARYSPIRANGFGNQGAYFSEIGQPLALKIAFLADVNLLPVLQGVADGTSLNEIEMELPAIQEWEDQQQTIIELNADIPITTRKALILARRGQGQFKRSVAHYEHSCRVTRVSNPVHLIASHIKPWREATDAERLSAGNGLMLTPSIDHLFDRGFITFADDGELIVSPVADRESLRRMGVQTREPVHVGGFNVDQRWFLEYHRTEIFLKSAS